jgi:hypothetical protein
MDAAIHSQNLERFGALVLADRKLLDELRAVQDVPAFAALTVRLGAEHGLVFTAATVQEALGNKRREWLERWL